MKIEPTSFGPWRGAWKCTLGEMELIAVGEIGPRIVSLRVGDGPNVLFDDSNGALARRPAVADEDWHIWGGHRFWISPESETTYQPDNAPCEVQVEDGRLTLTAPPEPSGLQKTLVVSGDGRGGGFRLTHRLRNTGEMLASGAIWALTCIEPTGRIVAPWGEGSESWRCQTVKYWKAWAGHGSDVASRQWRPMNDVFVVEPTGEEGKVGLYSDAGWLALLRDDATFIKGYDPIVEAVYPDGNCNVELYTCGQFAEMETLGPVTTFMPGVEYTHTEHWRIVAETFTLERWRDANPC